MELDKTYTLEEAKEFWGKNGITLPDLVAFAGELQLMSEKKRAKLLAYDEERAKKEGQMLRTLTRLLISYRLMKKGGLI